MARAVLNPKRSKNGKKLGRPSSYTPELGRRVCRTISGSRKGLTALSRQYDWFPKYLTIQRWRQTFPEFADEFDRAKTVQAQKFAEEQIKIADGIQKHVRTSKDNPGKLNAAVQAAKLQIEARRWAASRLAPRDWGDRIDVNAKVDTPDGNLDQLAGELAAIAARVRSSEDD